MQTPVHPYSLLTDLYQLTMAYGYWASGRAEDEAVFHLYFRRGPFGAKGALVGGIGPAAELVEQFRVDQEGTEYLRGLQGADGKPLFASAFLEWLGELRPNLQIDAVAEGEFVFPNQPILRVRGPLALCQILETPLLNLINFQTLIATKAARMRLAAGDDTILEMGLRRAQGPDGALSASRASYIGGVDATSNVLAGQRFDIPIRGTHAHSWVMAFEDEASAFETYAEHMPNNCILLVDTYDTPTGIRNAISTAKGLQQRGHRLLGIRLDSGNLTELSKLAREFLDQAGLHETAIVASNDLDEHRIKQLKQEGAKITVWGVGTRLVTAHDQPALGGVYKLGSIRRDSAEPWRDVAKHSEDPGKASLPGHLDILRSRTPKGVLIGDRIIDPRKVTDPDESASLLLRPLIRDGRRLIKDDLNAARSRASQSRAVFAQALMGAGNYPNTTEL